MIEIILDIETTGLLFRDGHRIIEIGCVVIKDYVIQPETFHIYINPNRTVPQESYEIHGISTSFLKDKPSFPEVVKPFLEFIRNHPIIAHNAKFDIGFINAELALLGLPGIIEGRVTDTLKIARKCFPGAPASLDALCRRFKVSLETRTKHGALVDARLLAEVYLNLLKVSKNKKNNIFELLQENKTANKPKINFPYRTFPPSQEEVEKHKEALKYIEKPLWEAAE